MPPHMYMSWTLTAVFLGILVPGTLSDRIISTSYGRIRGAQDYSIPGNVLYSFKSIPFANPPVGNLRFALPETPDPWQTVLDGRNYSAACISVKSKPPHSEDCLYINIFTSQHCLENQCPVIVYYHGGALNRDSAVMFPDEFIKERYVTQGIIFVIPAFRLGAFGQLYYGPSNVLSENLNMFDAVMALNFVHHEISNFGGDPKQVTLMGHSSGGSMVDALAFSKIVDPDMKMFQKTISLSAPLLFGLDDWMLDGSFMLTRKLHCHPAGKRINRTSANHAEMLNCLRKLSAFEILEMQAEITLQGYEFSTLIAGPPFMKAGDTIESLKKNAPPRKMITGVTETEFINQAYEKQLAPSKCLDFDHPSKVYSHFDEIFPEHEDEWVNKNAADVFVTALTYSEELVKSGGEVFLFETRQKPYSGHVTDMQYFIGIHRENHHTSDMDILDSFYSKMLVNFTKYNVPSPEWKALDLKKMNFLALEIDSANHIGPKMLENFHQKEREVWLGEMTKYDEELTKNGKEETEDLEDYEYFDIPKEEKTQIAPKYQTFPLYPNEGISDNFSFYFSFVFFVIAVILLVYMFRRRQKSTKGYEALL